MHRCLEVTELRLMIVKHIDKRDDTMSPAERKRSPAALAALARTCKAFHEFALDILWSVPGDLVKLIR